MKNIIIHKKASKRFFKEWIIPITIALTVAMLINKFLFFNIYVPSTSMVPTINVDDKIVVTRIYNMKNIKRGDIIVFYSDELKKVLIKRVIGLPGDKITIHDGIVNINGEDIQEDYVKNNERFNGKFDVPENNFFFLGDNRDNSDDARKWKNPYIDKEAIKGKAFFRFYPFNKWGSLSSET